jgi:DivIVA domain-containing protein
MRHWVLLLLLAVTVAVIAYLVVWIFTGNDDGLDPEEPDGRAVPLPGSRPLVESDISTLRFDTVVRGYRMVQVDAALRRAAYDVGYKQELIDVLEAEVVALRDGRMDDAEALRQARDGAVGGVGTSVVGPSRTPERDGTGTEAEAVESEAVESEAVEFETVESDAAEPDAVESEAGEAEAVESPADESDGVAVADRPGVGGTTDAPPNPSNRQDQTLGDRAATGR